MKTAEKYKEMGYAQDGDVVKDRQGFVYYPKKAKTPQKAIKLFCRECMGMDRREKAQIANVELVRDCVDPMCPLFDFRLGKNPFKTWQMSEEQKKAAVERLTLLRGPHLNSGEQDENQRTG